MVEKAKNASKHIDEIKEDLKALLAEVKSLDKHDLKELCKENYKDIKHALHGEEVQDSFNQALKEVENSIQEKPLRSISICMGIGFLLGKIF